MQFVTRPRARRLKSRLRRQNGNAVISVRDRGTGVPDEALEKIFRPFYRTEDARDRQSGGGTGLGLAITERAVRMHGGSVQAANAAGGGLSVEMRLDLGKSCIILLNHVILSSFRLFLRANCISTNLTTRIQINAAENPAITSVV